MKKLTKKRTTLGCWLARIGILGMAVLIVPGSVLAANTEAVDDFVVTTKDTSVDINIVDILDNDTPGTAPLNQATLTFDIATTRGGTVAKVGDVLKYTPPTGFVSVSSTDLDTFTYNICDTVILPSPLPPPPYQPPPASCDTATVSVLVAAEVVDFRIIPKKLNRNSKGVVPAVICGTEDFDVTKIDPETLRIMVDVSGQQVDPKSVKVPGHSNHLNLKFYAQGILPEIFAVFPETLKGDEITLYLIGNLVGGGVIFGEDVVIITGNPKKPPKK